MFRLPAPLARLASSSLAAILLLTALNVFICRPLFQVEYIDHFNSIEGSFIAVSQYMTRHWDDFSWFPMWHCGMPFQDTYVPLLQTLVAIVATAAKLSAARAYHLVCAVAYSLGPATLFLMAVRLGAPRAAAFLAALFYSLLSPCTFFLPAVAYDVGGWWLDRRLQVLTTYGEGPHITAMTIGPLALAALQSALDRSSARAVALAALAMAGVFLTNVPGTGGLALAVFCWICVQPAGKRVPAWIAAGLAGIFGYALACYGVPPSALATVAGNVGSMHPGFASRLHLESILLIVALLVVVAAGHLLSRTRLRLDLRFAILYFLLIAAAVLTARPSFELLPQSLRLQLEMEIGACLLLGALAWTLYQLIPQWIRPIVWTLCLAPIGLQVYHYATAAREDIRNADLAARSEYTTARWLDQNLHGRRVYAMGSASFWLNLFSDNPQLVGCCLQGQSMPVLVYVQYLINKGVSPRETQAAGPWLRALGVDAMVVSGPGSTDVYKDIQQPERFAGMFPVLHQEHGDTVYSVSPPSSSLAHIVRRQDLVPAVPAGQMQFADIVRYADAVSRPTATFDWLRSGAARIRANLRPGDLLSIQIPWFRGWKALVAGQPQPLSVDGLGFLAIQPACTGDCEILLQWNGRPDQAAAGLVSLLAFALFLLVLYTNKPAPDAIMKRMTTAIPAFGRAR